MNSITVIAKPTTEVTEKPDGGSSGKCTIM